MVPHNVLMPSLPKVLEPRMNLESKGVPVLNVVSQLPGLAL
jgi:hypothetical protein